MSTRTSFLPAGATGISCFDNFFIAPDVNISIVLFYGCEPTSYHNLLVIPTHFFVVFIVNFV
jgi:hypothetical protein